LAVDAHHDRVKSAWLIVGCFFWTSFPSIDEMRWRDYDNRWRKAR
jgi:hypothetical protein